MAVPLTRAALRTRTFSCHSCRQCALPYFIAPGGGPAVVRKQAQAVQVRSISNTLPRRNEARERRQQDAEDSFNEINDIGRLAKRERHGRRQQHEPAEAHSKGSPSSKAHHGQRLERLEGPEVEAEMADSGQQEPTFEGQSALEAASEAEARTEQREQQTPDVPWYLRLQPESSQARENPMAARQRIPDLPDHAPHILQPLMQHLSVALGMDDLSLLDLRALHPPPALGSNLFMLIGTARAEKHLHVSADKLCRWLRTEYRLTPTADGLLGRNELKLKVRRRTKRIKLMSAVGAQATGEGELDEGIRTGWVCVNVGRVEGGELPEQAAERERRAAQVVGFGTSQAGCNIVVQMMTEEKRGEIDLEKLWTGILNRSRGEKEAALVQEEPDGLRDEGTLMSELDAPGMANSVGSVPQDHAEAGSAG